MAEHVPGVSVGSYLRALRQDKRASLEEMARATRVGAHQLEALEADRFTDLPAPVFVKGFIRAYCHFLGEPVDEALRRYRDMLGERPVPARSTPVLRAQANWTASPLFISFVLLVVFGGGLLALNLGLKRGSKPAVSDPAPAVKVQAAPPPTNPMPGPPPTAPATPAVAAVESPTSQRLLVKAIEPTWIRIQTDDLRAVDELLPPGAIREWTAEKRFLLTVGNAGGIEIELNGRPMPRLGERGTVIRQLELPQAAAAGS
jgi:transcriptional regulator with XRE-family HTH domain